MLHLLVMLVFTLFSGVVASQSFSPPVSGITVDKSFLVEQLQQVSEDCIAWHIKGVELNVIVTVSKQFMEERAAQNLRNKAEYEDLKAMVETRDKGESGCVEFARTDIVRHLSPFYSAVRSGKATVLDGRNFKPAPHVVIRYSAQAPFGGHIIYSIPGQRPFWGDVWWVS